MVPRPNGKVKGEKHVFKFFQYLQDTETNLRAGQLEQLQFHFQEQWKIKGEYELCAKQKKIRDEMLDPANRDKSRKQFQELQEKWKNDTKRWTKSNSSFQVSMSEA